MQQEAAEDAVFEHEMRSKSTVSVATTPITTGEASTETVSRVPCKEPSEAHIPLQPKEQKNRRCQRKE